MTEVVDVFDGPALIRDGWCRGADLRGADLGGANLGDANLWGANLGDANLRGAVADKFTVWPDRFDHAARGVTIR